MTNLILMGSTLGSGHKFTVNTQQISCGHLVRKYASTAQRDCGSAHWDARINITMLTQSPCGRWKVFQVHRLSGIIVGAHILRL